MISGAISQKPLLQVQPWFNFRHEWKELAERENMTFEVLELSSPASLNDELHMADCRQWYRREESTESYHGAFIDVNPASGDPAFRELSQKRCRESCENAVYVGAENIVFHSSCATFLRGIYLERWADTCAAFYEELAETYGLKVFIENSQDNDGYPIAEIMRRTGHPSIGVCLDIGHVNYSRMPLPEWLELLGDRIGYLHISDNLGFYDDHLILGEGTVDFETADRFWHASGKKMPITLETGSIDNTERSIRFLKKHGLFGCTEG